MKDDNVWKPATPHSKAFLTLAPADIPELEDSRRAAFEADVTWFRSVCGSLQYVAKVRHDALSAINMCARLAHRPSADAKKAVKHVIFYLINMIVTTGLYLGMDRLQLLRTSSGIARLPMIIRLILSQRFSHITCTATGQHAAAQPCDRCTRIRMFQRFHRSSTMHSSARGPDGTGDKIDLPDSNWR